MREAHAEGLAIAVPSKNRGILSSDTLFEPSFHVREQMGQVNSVSCRDQLKVIPNERTMGARRCASSWIISAKRSAPTVPVVFESLASDAW